MDQTTSIARTGVTVRLPPDVKERVQHIAAAEYRSIAGYIEMLIAQDLHARDEAERSIHVFVAPELAGEGPGVLAREKGEDEARYAVRAEALGILLGMGRADPV